MSEPDAHQLEMLLIHVYGRIDNKTGCLANLTDGGEGQRGKIQTPEANQARREWMKAHPNRGNEVCPKWPKGKPKSEETKAKQRAAWTPELRKQMGAKHVGKKYALGKKHPPRSPEWCELHSKQMKGKQPWMTGKKHSEATKLKIFLSKRKQVVPSDEGKVKAHGKGTYRIEAPERDQTQASNQTGRRG
jgi:hypothetical protein